MMVYAQAQDTDTPTRSGCIGALRWRHAYARSAEARAAGEPGQDYVALKAEPRRFAFALCDGVSQSFFGELAARVLGDDLVDWLWTDLPTEIDEPQLALDLTRRLSTLSQMASQEVRAFRLPSGLPRLVQDVLREKQMLGSESMFVCGRIDLPDGYFPLGRLVVAWMGDSRLRFWGSGGERTSELGDAFHTVERWSSMTGAEQREPHVFAGPLYGTDGDAKVTRVMAYSDGLSALDGMCASESDAEIDRIIKSTLEQPTSDDVSFIDCGWDESESGHAYTPPVRALTESPAFST